MTSLSAPFEGDLLHLSEGTGDMMGILDMTLDNEHCEEDIKNG